MNVIFWIVLISLLFGYFVELLSTVLNLKSLHPDPPQGLDDVYGVEEYRKSQEYTRVRSKFGLLSSSFDTVVLLIFWFIGGFNYVDQMIRSMGWNDTFGGIGFIGLLVFGSTVLTIPFSLYSTFVIEEKFGFNKSTYRSYIADTLKALALEVAIMTPLLLGVLYFFEYTGSLAWLYVFTFVTLVIVFIQIVSPVWIMPIFNKNGLQHKL